MNEKFNTEQFEKEAKLWQKLNLYTQGNQNSKDKSKMKCKNCTYAIIINGKKVSCETEFDYPITTMCELFTDKELGEK